MKTIFPAVLVLALGATFNASGQESISRTLEWVDRIPVSGDKQGQAQAKAPQPFSSRSAVLKNAHLDMERDAMPIWQEVMVLPAGTTTLNAILADASYEVVPQALLDQLAPGGRLVIPVGAGDVQQLMLIVREQNGFSRHVLDAVRFVPLLNGPVA